MSTNAHKLIMPHGDAQRERVCLIMMPDAYDVEYHLLECGVADDAANHANRGRGDVTWHSIITYPQLRGVEGVTRVYIAWRGRMRAWQQADKVRKLERADLSGMDPSLANRMVVGAPYMWANSLPTILPAKEIPPIVRPVPLRFGWLTRTVRLMEISFVYPGRLDPMWTPGDEVIEWQ